MNFKQPSIKQTLSNKKNKISIGIILIIRLLRQRLLRLHMLQCPLLPHTRLQPPLTLNPIRIPYPHSNHLFMMPKRTHRDYSFID